MEEAISTQGIVQVRTKLHKHLVSESRAVVLPAAKARADETVRAVACHHVARRDILDGVRLHVFHGEPHALVLLMHLRNPGIEVQ